jgi:hypothetical protein
MPVLVFARPMLVPPPRKPLSAQKMLAVFTATPHGNETPGIVTQFGVTLSPAKLERPIKDGVPAS